MKKAKAAAPSGKPRLELEPIIIFRVGGKITVEATLHAPDTLRPSEVSRRHETLHFDQPAKQWSEDTVLELARKEFPHCEVEWRQPPAVNPVPR